MRDWAMAHQDTETVSAACGLSRMQRGESNQTTQRRQQVKESLHRVDIASTATSQSPGGCSVQSTSVSDEQHEFQFAVGPAMLPLSTHKAVT